MMGLSDHIILNSWNATSDTGTLQTPTMASTDGYEGEPSLAQPKLPVPSPSQPHPQRYSVEPFTQVSHI